MSKATFVTSWENGRPKLPPVIDPDGGAQLAYTDANGDLAGGFSTLSQIHEPTCVVIVDTSRAMLDTMIADTENYLLIEEIEDATG